MSHRKGLYHIILHCSHDATSHIISHRKGLYHIILYCSHDATSHIISHRRGLYHIILYCSHDATSHIISYRKGLYHFFIYCSHDATSHIISYRKGLYHVIIYCSHDATSHIISHRKDASGIQRRMVKDRTISYCSLLLPHAKSLLLRIPLFAIDVRRGVFSIVSVFCRSMCSNEMRKRQCMCEFAHQRSFVQMQRPLVQV